MKAGWKTTEFWLTLVAVLLGAAVTSGVIPGDGPWSNLAALVLTVLSAFGYTQVRGALKRQDAGGEK